ncbi:MAG: MBOAT family protein [Bacteroidales bacterium]|nr:MBOAT family protein [Bacteroidales bacterium]
MQNFFDVLKYNNGSPLVYNSVLFFILFTFFYSIYALVYDNTRQRNILILIFSLYFYYKVSGAAVILLVLMATSDYFIGRAIYFTTNEFKRNFFLSLSVVINVGCLAFFKYTNFLLENLFRIARPDMPPVVLDIILPIGISFFVFRSLSYVIDIHREVIAKPEKSYINYLLYVSFFPYILAGPISKARDILPQFRNKIYISEEKIGKGFFLIMTGAFKKVFISDFIATNFVDRVFDSPNFFTGFENLMASYGATIQVYCDFSGYTDIVIGIALLLGFTIDANFNKPFLAKNITDFWRRWHITLSRWLSEYLFYPLSYNFRQYKKIGVILAVLLTFIISGLWHGASWTFVLWGYFHGLALTWDIISQDFRMKISKKINPKVYNFISIFLTFHFVSFSIILFKSADLSVAGQIFSKIFTSFNLGVAGQWFSLYKYPFMMMLFAYALHFTPMKWNDILVQKYSKLHWAYKSLILVASIIFIYQAVSAKVQPFIYLEF